MAQECGFFNAELSGGEYDRVYNAEQFAAYFASFIGNGVFGNSMSELVVIENDTPNMSVNVSTGQAWINGWWYRNTEEYNLSVEVADGVLNRIDIVVLRWASTERDMWLQVVKGTPSANPIAPSITRNADYYDLKLCEISVPAGAINIRQAQITDTRAITDVCGFVTGIIDQIDATDLFLQFKAQFGDFMDVNYEEFDAWFQHMKDQLDEDAAGHLQGEIDEINTTVEDLVADTSKMYSTDDSASTTINDDDYIPISTSAGEKKKSLWSNIKTKLALVFASKTAITDYQGTPTNLANFVQNTAVGNLMTSFKISDTNNVLGFGNQWVKGYIQYQNAYGGQWDVNGMGIASIQGGNPIFIKITGTGTSFTVTRRDLTQDTNTVTDFTTVVASKTHTMNIGASVALSFSPSIPSGYTALGIIGFYSGNTQTIVVGLGMSQSSPLAYRMDLSNNTGQTITITSGIKVLCMKKS